jgi:hypothetical protein
MKVFVSSTMAVKCAIVEHLMLGVILSVILNRKMRRANSSTAGNRCA